MRISYWSSDVCSSDLILLTPRAARCPAIACLRHQGDRHCWFSGHGLRLALRARDVSRYDRVALRQHLRFASGNRSLEEYTIFLAPKVEPDCLPGENRSRSEEHTSELQSLMRISYAVFCLKKKNITKTI